MDETEWFEGYRGSDDDELPPLRDPVFMSDMGRLYSYLCELGQFVFDNITPDSTEKHREFGVLYGELLDVTSLLAESATNSRPVWRRSPEEENELRLACFLADEFARRSEPVTMKELVVYSVMSDTIRRIVSWVVYGRHYPPSSFALRSAIFPRAGSVMRFMAVLEVASELIDNDPYRTLSRVQYYAAHGPELLDPESVQEGDEDDDHPLDLMVGVPFVGSEEELASFLSELAASHQIDPELLSVETGNPVDDHPSWIVSLRGAGFDSDEFVDDSDLLPPFMRKEVINRAAAAGLDPDQLRVQITPNALSHIAEAEERTAKYLLDQLRVVTYQALASNGGPSLVAIAARIEGLGIGSEDRMENVVLDSLTSHEQSVKVLGMWAHLLSGESVSATDVSGMIEVSLDTIERFR